MFTGGTGTLNDIIEEALYYDGIDTSTITSIRFEKNSSTQALVKTMAIEWLFAGFPNLESFNGENLDVSNVESMYYWFSANPKLKNVDLSSWNVANIQNLTGLFLSCPELESVNLSGWTNTKGNALNMTDMFAATSKLETLVMTNVNLQNITNMNGMFTRTGLKEVDLSGLNTSNVTIMANIFINANKLEKVDLSTWDTQNVTSTLNMFTGTTSLWQIKLGANTVFKGKNPNFTAAPAAGTTIIDDGNTYTTLAAEWQIVGTGSPHQPNGAYVTTTEMYEDTPRPVTYVWAHTAPSALISGVHGTSPWTLDSDTGELIYNTGTFQNAQTVEANLESYDVDPDIVTSISFTGTVNLPADSTSMFSGLDSLTAFDATNSYTDNVTNMMSMFRDADTIIQLNLSNWDVGKVASFDGMFYETTKLTDLNLATWGVGRTATSVNMNYMFYNTTALTNLNLLNFKTNNVTTMSYTFRGTGLTELDLSDWDVTKVTTFAHMFTSATKLTTLNLSNWGMDRTATTVSMSNMFYNTTALIGLKLANFKTTNVTSMSAMFRNTGLTGLDLNDWDVTKVTTFANMFNGSSKLKNLDLSEWNTANASVNSMFSNTSNLWKIALGPNVKFAANPSFTAAPAAGTIIPGTSYVTSDASWQIVGTGTEFYPQGAIVTTTQMYADRSELVTYVWANQSVQPTPAIDTISSLIFGTLAASNFFNGNTPSATNMESGSVALKDLDSSTTYHVTVAQTSDGATDGESATIAKSNLKIKYGANDLSTGACSFWSGTSATATKSIAFNHDTNKNFSIWLNPNTVINSDLLGKQLESELTWTLSETP
ncbi:BspA family leucine-rich repeat surface protein [Leuconostoc falkenbergense]|uniref:BspA family leucine-rich repeat surface protein n=1 Tax=Leuconostoc falkenbergense TaxID=2766470 RepID=UPI0019678B88|nr:BspA family leucine-rich repeat surface protein [Leuconostoc falkenbergense]QSB51983.1 BspA family leucine-rich repeat surface protein [Leuconostoc falkenbergense]